MTNWKKKIGRLIHLVASSLLLSASTTFIEPTDVMAFNSLKSPNGKLSAESITGKVVIRDEFGKLISSFSATDPQGALENLEFVDDRRLGLTFHVNPSLEVYVEKDLSGKELHRASGYNFTWSRDRKTLAHVGSMIHFREWPHSEYIAFWDVPVYPRTGAAYGPDAKSVHTFQPQFVWSPNSNKMAAIDLVEGRDAGVFIVIVNRKGLVRRFKVDASSKALPDMKLRWQNNGAIWLEGKSFKSHLFKSP